MIQTSSVLSDSWSIEHAKGFWTLVQRYKAGNVEVEAAIRRKADSFMRVWAEWSRGIRMMPLVPSPLFIERFPLLKSII